jgi:hypothetical protein
MEIVTAHLEKQQIGQEMGSLLLVTVDILSNLSKLGVQPRVVVLEGHDG